MLITKRIVLPIVLLSFYAGMQAAAKDTKAALAGTTAKVVANSKNAEKIERLRKQLEAELTAAKQSGNGTLTPRSQQQADLAAGMLNGYSSKGETTLALISGQLAAMNSRQESLLVRNETSQRHGAALFSDAGKALNALMASIGCDVTQHKPSATPHDLDQAVVALRAPVTAVSAHAGELVNPPSKSQKGASAVSSFLGID